MLGADALAALAVPARFAILRHLLAVGPQTASECAAVVGESASNCSWHLRALAAAGLVERAVDTSGDGRRRPWRATAVGFQLSADRSPAGRLAARAIGAVLADADDELYRRHLTEEPALPEEWQQASGAHSWSLLVTPAELASLVHAVDDLLTPYRRATRMGAPEDAQGAAVSLRAFPHPDRGQTAGARPSPGAAGADAPDR